MDDNNVTIIGPNDQVSPDEQIRQMLAAIPKKTFESMKLFAQKEDYTASSMPNRTVEELPVVVTIGTDVYKRSTTDENLAVFAEDEYGIHVDLVGTKGYIPASEMLYNRQANFSAIFTTLENGVYRVTYKQDPLTGIVEKDEFGKPIVLRRVVVHGGVAMRNMNQLNNLALEGLGRVQQNRVLGAWGNVSPVGMDGSLDNAIANMMSPGGGKSKNKWGRRNK